ncbi:efflux RND transporter periplasmic adaptor subunit [Flavobacterium gawalongense]|uniref:Efflux RND transporter periplasmic adaptor subunit n=1 Tax=Flavobacterium gawalongense TaxID=2594432 RepID=A0A553BCR2_9FLAO|nr:efflux RND transporter periplasmic adaptor subunit [Flavobacterium gawalongense]TRW98559.1 efflux RND transporter periplasmic adaptor subunit [Flavobacterium gawalongense]TRX03080.1 efflux RND transporter periplasmic adaptor subunit [Flavobacterium gawalongense]TRX06044.1 efflux RND transporter periplasmic adaptor subunit [Flavobacterium gawalongense]TRX10972.1 efflux RND transporter periplasmic adaptor subunit [Flavobacterium gawalongense]TRX22608.1 efflux RND transporter periplasmic adapt
MKNKLLKTSILFLVLTSTLIGCNSEKKEIVTIDTAPAMEIFTISKEKLATELRIPAELTGFQQVDIYAKVSSFVKELKVDIGSQVKKGQLLIILEAPEISSQLAAAQSRQLSQKAIYTASKSTFDRLFETSKIEGTISKNDLEQAAARKNSDYAQYLATQAAYKEISIMKSYLEIRAPFDGIISARNVNPGAYVGPAGKGSESPLFTLQQQVKLRLSVYVPELYTGYLKIGDELTFNVKSINNQTFNAKIARMSGALDSRLRSERVELDVVNKTKKLLPGMVAEVLLPLKAKDSNYVVPKSSVVTSSDGVYVLRVENNKTIKTPVQKGRELENRVEIFGNIPENSLLVKVVSEEIKDGTAVK